VITGSIRACLEETRRRRHLQTDYNRTHGITPESIRKSISDVLTSVYDADYVTVPLVRETKAPYGGEDDLAELIARLKAEMKAAAAALEFEKAAELRDEIRDLSSLLVEFGGESS